MKSLKVNNLNLNIGDINILRNISIIINRGEFVGLAGPNGAGKSSLLKSILGLMKVESGSIEIDNEDTALLNLKERAKKMTYVAQGAPVHWPLDVEHIVGLGRIPHLNPWQKLTETDHKAINDAMIKTDCIHLKGRSITTLSGGERARVLLARALATDTPYILADEPVSSLDPAHQLQVMDILKSLKSEGKGVLVVMHDLSMAARYCDNIILLEKGRMLGQDEPDIMLNDENLKNVFSVRASRWADNGENFMITHQL